MSDDRTEPSRESAPDDDGTVGTPAADTDKGAHDRPTRPMDESPDAAADETTRVTERERIQPFSKRAGRLGSRLRDIAATEPTDEMQMHPQIRAEWERAAGEPHAAKTRPMKAVGDDGEAAADGEDDRRSIQEETTVRRQVSEAVDVDDEGYMTFLGRPTEHGDIRLPPRLQRELREHEGALILFKARVLTDEE